MMKKDKAIINDKGWRERLFWIRFGREGFVRKIWAAQWKKAGEPS